MKRYSLYGCGVGIRAEEDESGAWVRWGDVAPFITMAKGLLGIAEKSDFEKEMELLDELESTIEK